MPTLPEKDFFNYLDSHVVDKRRKALEEYMTRIVQRLPTVSQTHIFIYLSQYDLLLSWSQVNPKSVIFSLHKKFSLRRILSLKNNFLAVWGIFSGEEIILMKRKFFTKRKTIIGFSCDRDNINLLICSKMWTIHLSICLFWSIQSVSPCSCMLKMIDTMSHMLCAVDTCPYLSF